MKINLREKVTFRLMTERFSLERENVASKKLLYK